MKGTLAVVSQFCIGLLFGLGLILAGMSDPAKVLGFLDIGAGPRGGWDPSLAFVMIGAIGVTALGYRLVLRGRGPLFDDRFHLPPRDRLDRRIVIGPAIFGIGWGLAGFCPGPAFTAVIPGSPAAVVFVLALIAGAFTARRWFAPR